MEINLTQKHFIAKGGERICYVHPEDPSKVIKIIHRKGKHNNQNELEYRYMKFLNSKNIKLTHLVSCYGFVSTNLGEGLIFDRVINYDGTFSKSFKDLIFEGFFSKKQEMLLIEELKAYLFSNKILFIDVDLSNVFCKEVDNGIFKLIIVDGLGARRMGLRFSLYLKSKLFTKYKIVKQWKKFLINYQKVSFQLSQSVE